MLRFLHRPGKVATWFSFIEKPVGLLGINHQLRAVAQFSHFIPEFSPTKTGINLSLPPQEHDSGRHIFLEVVHRRDLLVPIPHLCIAKAFRPVVIDWIKRTRASGIHTKLPHPPLPHSIQAPWLQLRQHARLPIRRLLLSDGGRFPVCPHSFGSAKGGFSILYAFKGGGLVPGGNPVLRRHRHHSPPGQILALRIKLFGRAPYPSTPKRKKPSQACGPFFYIMPFGKEAMDR